MHTAKPSALPEANKSLTFVTVVIQVNAMNATLFIPHFGKGG